jgi:Mn-dependent DtxR family transcriptional regulator
LIRRCLADQPSRPVQDYLKAIHSLGGGEKLVLPVELAARLEVRAASVTGMLKRWAAGGWIEYQAGRGAQSTALGTSEARPVIRRIPVQDQFAFLEVLEGHGLDYRLRKHRAWVRGISVLPYHRLDG